MIYLFRKNTLLFRPAMIAFGAGTIFHLVSIVELWVETGHLPLNNFYENKLALRVLGRDSIPLGLLAVSDCDIQRLPIPLSLLYADDWRD